MSNRPSTPQNLERPLTVDIDNKIFCGDSIEFMRQLPAGAVDVIITDPPWPNCGADIPGRENPLGLWRRACEQFPRIASRLVVVLGCDSDVRFLSCIPTSYKFLRACWLRYAIPHYKGPILYTADVAYVFSVDSWLPEGQRVMPGETVTVSNGKRAVNPHPCYRPLDHMAWLVKNFSRKSHLVFDPFCGSGNILLAARLHGRRWCGVDIEPKYADFARAQLAGVSPQERLAVGVD